MHPLQSIKPDPSHFEPESDEYLDELILEDRRRARRRRITWLVGVILIILGLLVAGLFGYRWTQSHYFVGQSQGNVAIFQGVQQSLGPIALSSVVQRTSIDLNDLPSFSRSSVEATISADDLDEAQAIVDRLADDSEQ